MDNKILLAIVLGVLLVCSLFALSYAMNKPAVIKEVPTTQLVLVQSAYNDTVLVNQVSTIQVTLDKDDKWELDAIKIAEDDWNNEKDLYNALIDLGVTDLDDKSDISKVVIKDTEVSGDTEDKDADVSQEVRVYYESSTGDNVRITLQIDTEILENDVEDVEFSLA